MKRPQIGILIIALMFFSALVVTPQDRFSESQCVTRWTKEVDLPFRLKRPTFICTLILSLTISTFAYSQEVQTNGKVCGSPSAPCSHNKWKFSAEDLSFKLPKTLKWQTNYHSANFYAIILKSQRAVEDPDGPAGAAECSGYFSESERSKIQKSFPANKVFASRFGCGDPATGYTNVNFDYNILAVYAGGTEREAKNFLKIVKAKGYSDANIRRMQVVVGYGD
jgi:hypothetical protein